MAIFQAPNIAALSEYIKKHYPDAVARLLGQQALDGASQAIEPASDKAPKVDESKIARIRELIVPLAPRPEKNVARPKNPPAVFILSPPRSGSTLLRVMLAGNPRLFAPQELEFLSFNTLAERRSAFSGQYSFWLEGAIRAVMEVRQCDAEQARGIVEEYEDSGTTTQQFYRLIQEWIGEKMLVDKTPSYALDTEILRRAEADFDGPRYVYLLRHPHGMIRSFVKAKLEQVFFIRYSHNFSALELAEMIWLISHQNILAHLAEIPQDRQHVVKFEDLVSQPKPVLEGICQFLRLPFHPDMLQPYKDQEKRMTDGIHPLSKMVGDIRVHEHKDIDSSVADKWRESFADYSLSDLTWRVAEKLGYERPGDANQEPGKRDDLPVKKRPMPINPISVLPRGNSNLHDLVAKLSGISTAEAQSGFADSRQTGTDIKTLASHSRVSTGVHSDPVEAESSEQ